ncbi:hypothetical protein BbuMM1_N170 (plasmid) [Borreliella burgdorferi]|nr:hypothetical protein BbuMM1_N170 [Borreliella burgdorferi]
MLNDKRNRDIDKAIASLNETRKKYFNLLDELRTTNTIFQ